MLVLTRKGGEALTVGEARIVVLAINGNKVRLGIEADKSVKVVRDELERKDGGGQ